MNDEFEITLEKVKLTVVKDVPGILKDDCRRMVLFGSCARGDYNDESDVDIAIFTDCSREEAKKYSDQIDNLAADIGIDTMAVVNFVLLPLNEYEEKKNWYPFFMNIAREGKVLYEC